jgi:hypothetical protein
VPLSIWNISVLEGAFAQRCPQFTVRTITVYLPLENPKDEVVMVMMTMSTMRMMICVRMCPLFFPFLMIWERNPF